VIVPELDKALGHNVAVLVASREAERAMQRRFHFASFPALVFLREGAYLGAMEGIRDWQDYVAELPEMLTRQPASPPPFRMPQGCATRRRRLMSGSPSIPGLEDLLGALAGPQVGPGSQPDGPDEARLDYMIMPEEMRVFSMAAIPDSASGHAAGLAAGEAILARWNGWPRARKAWTFARWGRMIWPLSTSCWARARFRWCWAPNIRRRRRCWQACGACARTRPTARAWLTGWTSAPFRRALSPPRWARRGAKPCCRKAIEGVFNAPSLIAEINAHIPGTPSRAEPHVINLSLLPHTEGDLAFLEEALGPGDLIILSRGYGNCRIRSTGTRHCWWVRYFNSQDTLILNSIEISPLPTVAQAAPRIWPTAPSGWPRSWKPTGERAMEGGHFFEGSFGGNTAKRPANPAGMQDLLAHLRSRRGLCLLADRAGHPFADLPDHWTCPECDAPKQGFMVVE
jgi:hydrogenase-1 operon protein HyaF